MPKEKIKSKKKIPPPPGPEVSWEDQSAYFEKYGLDELEKADYLEPMTKEDLAFVEQVQKTARAHIAERTNRPQLNISFAEDQLSKFLNLAKSKHIPPSTLAKSWILERLDREVKKAS